MIPLKTVRYFVFCIVLVLGANTFAQGFEGKVVFRISEDETLADMDYFVKDNKMRMEMKSDDGSVVILFDQKESTAHMIMPEQQMYMEFKGMDYLKDELGDDSETDIERTGELMNINGYKCEKWIIKEDGDIVEAWMTDEIGGFFMMDMDNSMNKWQQELMGKYFPMRVDIIEGSEKKKVMEVISVNKMSLSSDLFDVPKGYQKFEMPNMDMYKQD